MSSRVGSTGPGQGAATVREAEPERAAPLVARPPAGPADGVSAPPAGEDRIDWGAPGAGVGVGTGTATGKPGGESLVARLASASYQQLRKEAEAALGEASFGVGVAVGIVKTPIEQVAGLLELQKTFVLAELYDRLNEPLTWKDAASGPSAVALKLGGQALVTLGALDLQELRQAHDQREALTRQLDEVLSHPLEYLSDLPGQLRDEYVGKWNQFRELSKQTDPKSQYEAGKILGELVFEVASSVAGLASGAGAAAKLASKAPQLLKLGRLLDKVDVPGPDGAAGRARAATKPGPDDVAAQTRTAAKQSPDDVRSTNRLPDANAVADRKKITELSLAGKTAEARALLRPHLDEARLAKTPAQKQAAMDAIIDRLDLTSTKPKMFWSGNGPAAARLAENRGLTVMEHTPGGRVVDNWNELGQVFKWDEGMPPRGPDFWGKVSGKYAGDVRGTIEVVQTSNRFPGGGEVFRRDEWPKIFAQAERGEVKELVLHRIDDKGKVLETRRLDPLAPETKRLFGGE